MKLINSIFAIGIAIAANASATTVYLDSDDGVTDTSGHLVAPYFGRLDTVAYNIFCDDFDHKIGVPDSVVVNVSTINDLSKTRFGALAGALSFYEQVFYLSNILNTANSTDRGNIQDAIWGYFAADAPNQGSAAVQGWKTQAAANYLGKDYSGFRILTDASDQFNGKQELFVNTGTPEPGTLALLFSGASGFAFLRFRRKKA